jgi:hypothetical protein
LFGTFLKEQLRPVHFSLPDGLEANSVDRTPDQAARRGDDAAWRRASMSLDALRAKHGDFLSWKSPSAVEAFVGKG